MRDEFYVGYLPMPPSHARFVRALLLLVFVGIAAVAVIVARTQRDPGAGVWMIGPEITYEGVLRTTPYPMLEERTPDGPRAALLVEVGKRGARERATPFDGKMVRVKGWPIEREGRRIIELAPDASAIQPIEGEAPAPASEEAIGPITLRGEIVDTKCFYGAMKPGDGKTHKACATLCIRGGIPPTLVTTDEQGRHAYYLLRGPDGGPCRDDLLPFVGEPVRVEGTLSRFAGLLVLSVRGSDVSREP